LFYGDNKAVCITRYIDKYKILYPTIELSISTVESLSLRTYPVIEL